MNKIFAIILFIFFSSLSFSQVKVQVFDGNNSNDSDQKSDRNYTMNDRNLISLNTYLLGRGIFALSYERVLAPMHSISFTGGLTYRDLIFELFHEDEFKMKSTENDYGVYKQGTKSSAGYMFDVSYKFYPKSYNDFEGFYISPGFAYKHYTYKDKFTPYSLQGNPYSNYANGYSTYTSGSSVASIEQPVNYDLTEASLKIGFMYEPWWYDDLIIDFYCGFGYRNATITGYNVTKVMDPSAPSPNADYYFYQLKPTTFNVGSPCVYLGAKMGIPF